MSEFDLHLWTASRHYRSYQKLGAHLCQQDGQAGVHFAVWAPNASGITVMGEFNAWDRSSHPLPNFDHQSGIWSGFVPGIESGDAYKYCVYSGDGWGERCDPYGFWSELRPSNASRIWDLGQYQWGDAAWMEARKTRDIKKSPLSVYEVHLGSWMRRLDNSWMTYRELADKLVDYVAALGSTHVELLPITEHPFDGSWGYQTTGYFCASSRFGTPDDLRYLIDQFHQRDIGVILDWVPAHFPSDGHGLAYFDGTHLFEHEDRRMGFHLHWNTLIFNFGRNEVRNFLISSALFWLEEYHIDGLRVDAVTSMLYRDFGRENAEWLPNEHGGRENFEAIGFLQEMNQAILRDHPDVFTVAEESASFPKVTGPVEDGGLGFTFKWNMGWMHDTLTYFQEDPLHRKWHQNKLTFGMMYQYSENFMLPFSHDEVVHLKKSMLSKMPGDAWQMRANLRALLGYQFGYPGKKLLFMGVELGQWSEWNHDTALDWALMGNEEHRAMLAYSQALHRLYRNHPACYELDHDPKGFQWLDCDDADHNLLIFRRQGTGDEVLVFVCNFSPTVRKTRLQLPFGGTWKLLMNSDQVVYGGSGLAPFAGGELTAEEIAHRGQTHSCGVELPPLAVFVLAGRQPVAPKSRGRKAKAERSE